MGGAQLSLANWIKNHRKELDEHIQDVVPGAPRNDQEREVWVLNDEGLYLWAKGEGVSL